MKKLFFTLVLIVIWLVGFVNSIYAATPTPTEKPKNPADKFTNLIDRIASTVADKKLVDRRGVIGIVSEVSGTQITLNDSKDNLRLIDVDELTKFSSPSAKESFGISDINKGTKVGVLGLYNKQSRRILARFVSQIVLPKALHGAVSNIDKDNFTITVISSDKTLTVIDVENITKTMSYTKDSGLVRSGFSKIKTGERITAIGFPAINEKKRLIASRIIVFPDIPKDPAITLPEPALSEQDKTVPSTGSGKKLTPIVR